MALTLNSAQDTNKDYVEDFVHVNDINLHYMDWGGTGEALVLVHAWGDSPYIFSDLASRLKNNFRIISYSGRGHARSDAPNENYEIPVLAEDMKGLLDTLKINRVNLLGFSSAGNEITEFTIQYPARVNKLIFLEAGYDLSTDLATSTFKNIPADVNPGKSAYNSVDNYRKWFHDFWYGGEKWNELLEKNFQAVIKINRNGTVTLVPEPDISDQLLRAHLNYYRDYSKIKAPVLAIFGNRFLLPSSTQPEIVSAYDNWEKSYVKPWKDHSIKRLQTEINDLTLKIISEAAHMSIICNDQLTKIINEFIEK